MFRYIILMLFRSKDFFPAIAFLLIIILVILMFSSPGYVPYTKDDLFPKHYTYEALTNTEKGRLVDDVKTISKYSNILSGTERDMFKFNKDVNYLNQDIRSLSIETSKPAEPKKDNRSATKTLTTESSKEKSSNKSGFANINESFSVSDMMSGNAFSGWFGWNPVEAFEGILPKSESASLVNTKEVLDKFSHVSANSNKNDNSCYSGGLSNSKGPLCLTPELVGLLKSRGGNM